MLSTFPKSGTHWVQFIIQLLLKKGEPIRTHKEFTDNMRILEYSRCQDWKSVLPLRLFFSHLPLSRDRMTQEAKFVYIARNPWDVCVSFFHWVTNLTLFEFCDGTFEEFVEAFIDGSFGYGDYFEHVASGYALRNEPNLFFLTYEELQANKRTVVQKLAHFLGEEYGEALESNQTLLEQLLERSSAEEMKSILVVDMQGGLNKEWQEVLSRCEFKVKEGHGGDKTKFGIVRTAKVGGWKEHFTPQLLRRMELRIREAEKTTSFMDLWRNIRDEAIEAYQA